MSGSKIGLIFPAGGRKSPEEEIGRYLPEDMALISHQIRFDQISPQGLTEMGERVEGAAVELAKQGVSLVLFCCTSGSFIGGIGYDARLMERMEAATGLPALTTSTAVVAALRALEIRRLSMGTPYPDPVNEAEIDFLARSGVRVVKAKGLGIERPPLVSQTPPERLIQLAEEKKLSYALDVYPFYGSDGDAALRAGYDLRHGLIGPGVYASHGYERSHKDGVENTFRLLKACVTAL